MTAKEAAWYAGTLDDPERVELLAVDLVPVYQAIGPWLRRYIIDLGCCVGGLAHWARDHGWQPDDYHGYDFVPAYLDVARSRMPGWTFDYCDLRITMPYVQPAQRQVTTYVLLEVLEHLNRPDVVLGRIPKGGHVVYSVPDYDSEAHVRTYPDLASATSWDDLLDVREAYSLPVGDHGGTVHLVDALRR